MNTSDIKLVTTQSTVYILDDEPQLVELLSKIIELTGLKPLGYTRASQFFEQVSTFEQASILVLDLNMPEIDGIEVMRRLSSMDSSPALILMSGHDASVLHSAEKLGHAHNLEIIASLNKPILLDDFKKIIEHHSPNIERHKKLDTSEINDNITVEADSAIPALTEFDIRFSWSLDGAMANDMYYGALDLGTDAERAGNLGLISFDIARGADDVSISSDASAYMQRTDMVNYEVAVLANLALGDRLYTVQAKIPAGMELEEGSVTGDATIDGDTITWMVAQESLYGAAPTYTMTTNIEDASCALPNFGQGGGYIDVVSLSPTLVPETDLDGDTQTASYDVAANFLGKLYSSINVTDDGYIYFSGAHGSKPWINQLLPDANEANDLVAPFWRDMEIVRTDTSGVTVVSGGPNWTIVEFDDMRHYDYHNGDQSVSDILDFEVVFSNATGDFMFAYDNVEHVVGDDLGVTVGYENATGTAGSTDIYAQSPYSGGQAGAISSVQAIESGLIMCYTLQDIESSPLTLNFSTMIVDNFNGGPVNVELTQSVDAINTVEVVNSTSAAIQVEGAPIAMITAPSAVQEKSSVAIDGSGSTDPNGDDLTYTWTQIGGTPVNFNASASSFSFEAPNVSSQNSIVSFNLMVDDGNGNTDTAIVAVKITNITSSGGGSFGWLSLALLPLVWLRRKKANK